MRLVPFVPAHIDALRRANRLGRYDADSIIGLEPAAVRVCGAALTALDGADAVVGCGGLEPLGAEGEGRAVAWLLGSAALRRERFFLHRVALRGLRDLVPAHGLRRVEATVHPDFPAAARWLERLGFRLTGIRRHAVTQKPYRRYVYERSRDPAAHRRRRVQCCQQHPKSGGAGGAAQVSGAGERAAGGT